MNMITLLLKYLKLKKEGEVKYFKVDEFDSPDMKGSWINMDHDFLQLLDFIRERVEMPLHVTSGFRTLAHNKKVGGEEKSAHCTGNAVDLEVASSGDRFKIVKAALNIGIVRIGIGEKFVHLDNSPSLPQNVIWFYPTVKPSPVTKG